MTGSRQLLDRVQSPAQIAAIAADPSMYAVTVAAELASRPATDTLAELAARDEVVRDALARLDAMIERVARIRFDYALATDGSADVAIAAPTRKVFAATIVNYAAAPDLLATRAHDAAVRGGARDPAAAAALVIDAARATLELRAAMRAAVLDLVRDHATAAIEPADRRARDRQLDDAARRAWSAMRREQTALAADPARVAIAPIAVRLRDWPDQLDEPDPEREVTFADMIELD